MPDVVIAKLVIVSLMIGTAVGAAIAARRYPDDRLGMAILGGVSGLLAAVWAAYFLAGIWFVVNA